MLANYRPNMEPELAKTCAVMKDQNFWHPHNCDD
jgi:hypothetical protein